MAILINTLQAEVTVHGKGGKYVLPAGQPLVVDDKTNWGKHPYVTCGALQLEAKAATTSDKADKPELPPITVEDITGEDGVYTVRASDGVVFSPAKNQVRKDGTLTSGGMKVYEEAKAKAQVEDETKAAE